MSFSPNNVKWGGQPYTPLPDPAGPPQMYAPQYAPPSYPPNDYPAPSGYPPNEYPSDEKSPFEGGRFAPKKKINDPIFLALYIITVSACDGFVASLELTVFARFSGLL